MNDIKRSLELGAAWITIAYIVCFVGVALFPSVRTLFVEDALHMEANFLGQNIITFRSFWTGLVLWNALALLGVGLFKLLDGGFTRP